MEKNYSFSTNFTNFFETKQLLSEYVNNRKNKIEDDSIMYQSFIQKNNDKIEKSMNMKKAIFKHFESVLKDDMESISLLFFEYAHVQSSSIIVGIFSKIVPTYFDTTETQLKKSLEDFLLNSEEKRQKLLTESLNIFMNLPVDNSIALMEKLEASHFPEDFQYKIMKAITNYEHYLTVYVHTLLQALEIISPFIEQNQLELLENNKLVQEKIEQYGGPNSFLKKIGIELSDAYDYTFVSQYFSPLDISISISIDKDIATVAVGTLIIKLTETEQDESYKKEAILSTFKLLADPTKLHIMELVKNESLYSQQIATALNLTPATISYHLKLMAQNKLVTTEFIDNKSYYHINKETVEEILSFAKELLLED